MDDEMKYEFGDNEILIKEHYDNIYLYEKNHSSELAFLQGDIDKVIQLLENVSNYLEEDGNGDYVDLGIHEGEDENGDCTGEYYWTDGLMYNDDINPNFLPEDNFYGNCIYIDNIKYILEALREYANTPLSSVDRLNRLTLKSILRLRRSLTNGN